MQLLADGVFQRPCPHVARMRVEGARQAAEIDLQEVGHVEQVDQPVPVAVADRQPLDRLVALGLVELELELVELDPLPPPLLRLRRVGRVVDQVGIVDDRLIDGEVGLLLEELEDGRQPLVGPLRVSARRPAARSRGSLP